MPHANSCPKLPPDLVSPLLDGLAGTTLVPRCETVQLNVTSMLDFAGEVGHPGQQPDRDGREQKPDTIRPCRTAACAPSPNTRDIRLPCSDLEEPSPDIGMTAAENQLVPCTEGYHSVKNEDLGKEASS